MCIFNFKTYRYYFSVKTTIKMCLLAWSLGITADLPNFFGIGDHVYDLKVLSCHFDRLKAPYTITIAIVCVIIPCVCIGVLYTKIFYYTSQIRNKLSSQTLFQKYRTTFRAVKIAKSLFASFVLFFICW